MPWRTLITSARAWNTVDDAFSVSGSSSSRKTGGSTTFVDLEHFIIPDQITIGGTIAGLIASFIVPEMMSADSRLAALVRSALAAALGYVILWIVLEGGKIAFGKDIPAVERIAVVTLRRGGPVPREEAHHAVRTGKRSQRRAAGGLLAVDGLLPAGEGQRISRSAKKARVLPAVEGQGISRSAKQATSTARARAMN